MKNFVIFFDEKEGTSPLVRLLDRFDEVSIIHQVEGKGWEPFDRHQSGRMSLNDLRSCLEIAFTGPRIDFARLNQIYLKTARRPIQESAACASVGFKMRFLPHVPLLPLADGFSAWNRCVDAITQLQYRRMMFEVLKRKNVTVFLAVRQDVLKWALSKYHGDGSGKPGHLQFKVARTESSSVPFKPISVDCVRLQTIVDACGRTHERKRRLMEALRSHGITVHVLRYEDFNASKDAYLARFFELLGIQVSAAAIRKALSSGAHFKKVHPDDIASFVTNHEEVLERVGTPFIPWA